jgi:ribonuclease BN (tRNA processing enzyme)
MKVTFLGTGTCIDTTKAQSCVLVESDETKILVDIGIGAFTRLKDEEINGIDAVLITHNHLDHNGDLLALLKARWLKGGDELAIYGPIGMKAFIESLLEAYAYLRRKLRFKVFEDSEFKIGDFEIKTIPTFHSIVSRAYVISEGDKTLVVSGDTRAFRELMEVKCDVLIHEMSLPFGYESRDHTTPENMSEVLEFCRANEIYLTHMYPHTYAIRDKIIEHLKNVRRDIDIKVAEDLMSFEI